MGGMNDMLFMGIIIVITGLFIFLFNLVYFFRGRKANRILSLTNGLAGLFAAVMYSIFLVDNYLYDFLSSDTVRAYCMRPITVVMLGAILANSMRMRWAE
jgi:hypothetical protein